jgi:outer membrane lipoprotein SlyB
MSSKHHISVFILALFLMALRVFAQKAPEIPTGTTIKVRMVDRLSSEDARIGDNFHATLEEPITVGERELYPRGAEVTGRVVDVHQSGRLSEPGELDLVLNTVSSGGRTSSLRVEPLVMKGDSHAKSNATKIGGGAALGAIIGAIAGGGKGAAIGTVAGGAAGTGAAAATGKKEVEVLSETVLSFVTSTSADVTGTVTTKERESTASNSSSSTTSSSSDADLFTLRDRRVIRSCVSDHASEIPENVTHRPQLLSGDDRDLHRDGKVPSSIEKQLHSLPIACVDQLPKLPSNQERVLYAGRVLLVDSNNRILDMFDLEDQK